MAGVYVHLGATVITRRSDPTPLIGISPRTRKPSLFWSPEHETIRMVGGVKSKLKESIPGLYYTREQDTEHSMENVKVSVDDPSDPLDSHVAAWLDAREVLKKAGGTSWAKENLTGKGHTKKLKARNGVLRLAEDSFGARMAAELHWWRKSAIESWAMLSHAAISLQSVEPESLRNLHDDIATARELALYGFYQKLQLHSAHVDSKSVQWAECALDCLGANTRDYDLQISAWNSVRRLLNGEKKFWAEHTEVQRIWEKEAQIRQKGIRGAHQNFVHDQTAKDLLDFTSYFSRMLTQLKDHPDLVKTVEEKLGLDRAKEALLCYAARSNQRTDSVIHVFKTIRDGQADVALETASELQLAVANSRHDAPAAKLPRWRQRGRDISFTLGWTPKSRALGRNRFSHMSSSQLSAELEGIIFDQLWAQIQAELRSKRSDAPSPSVIDLKFDGTYSKQRGTLIGSGRKKTAQEAARLTRTAETTGGDPTEEAKETRSRSRTALRPANDPGIPNGLAAFAVKPTPFYMNQLLDMLQRSQVEFLARARKVSSASAGRVATAELDTGGRNQYSEVERLKSLLRDSVQEAMQQINTNDFVSMNCELSTRQAVTEVSDTHDFTEERMKDEADRRKLLRGLLLASSGPEAGRARSSSLPPPVKRVSDVEFDRLERNTDKDTRSEADMSDFEDEMEGAEDDPDAHLD